MSTTDPVIARVARANPAPAGARGLPDDRAAAERTLARVLAQPVTRPGRRPRIHVSGRMLVPVLSTVVVVVVAALFIRAGSGHTGLSASAQGSGSVITLQAMATFHSSVTPRAMSREIDALRRRSDRLGIDVRIRASGDRITIAFPRSSSAAVREVLPMLLGSSGLVIYDWETNVLTPNGRTVDSQLHGRIPRDAMTISQGGTATPGTAGAGGMALYDAVVLASKQAFAASSSSLSRIGSIYYLFADSRSAACAKLMTATGDASGPNAHCLLAGPIDEPTGVPAAAVRADLAAELPAGVSRAAGRLIKVPQGTVVLEAQTGATTIPYSSNAARFFVLRDRVALSGADITDVAASVDPSGSPDVQFRFRGAGVTRFQAVTASAARRGLQVSLGQMLEQHFAIGIDGQLLSVPSIDFKQYPDGIVSRGGSDLTGGFTRASARALAAELRAGALPLQLRLVR